MDGVDAHRASSRGRLIGPTGRRCRNRAASVALTGRRRRYRRRMDRSATDVVHRDDTTVRYIEVADEAASIQEAWRDLEAMVGALRGRRFLGAVFNGRYRACVECRDDATGSEADLPQGVVPGGSYLRLRLRGQPPEVYDRITPAAEQLSRYPGPDSTRPVLELYLRSDRIDVLQPLR
jgi:hypothetical protein